MKFVLISSSLSAISHSRHMLGTVCGLLQDQQIDTDIIDLQDLELEWCDGRPLESYHAGLHHAFEQIAAADAIIIASPVYYYSISGVLKNFLDITSGAFLNKKFGMVIAAGGDHAFMAAEQLRTILALESRATALPRFVYASESHFENHILVDEKIRLRLQQFVEEMITFTQGN